MEIDENNTDRQDAEVKAYWESRTGQPYGDTSEPLAPAVIYSLDFDAEQLLAVYGALRVYLRMLANQEQEDLETLARTVRLLSEIKPRAVEASRSLALKTAPPACPAAAA